MPASAINPTMAVPSRSVPVTVPVPLPAPAAIPPGTFAAGTKVQVGGLRVVIDRYLSEGGFAHVYLVTLPKPINGSDVAVLKRVAVPDKEALANMKTEVETMKKLKGRRHIVTYIDSHASQLKGGGYEVFLLMEYCAGGGLIDFMNTRLQNRLKEPEILQIFSDVAEGVACMHYLEPPLLHRDLKVENVLIASTASTRRFKLCDFGSAAHSTPAPTTAAECRLIEDDIQRHTTLQYRSPEMVDVYRKQPIDEKSDIWALGVLLYKLCYYTTPFEEQGQLAILNASFKFPGYPPFSDRLKMLIAWMLRENPQLRPNIYQVVREISLMQGKEVPLADIYTGRSQADAPRDQTILTSEPLGGSLSTAIGASHAPPAQPQRLVVPKIVPMRRGRPNATSPEEQRTKPSASPLRVASSDPFAALDKAPDASLGTGAGDELSARFPSLDQFSLLHDSGARFDFDQKASPNPTPEIDISQRVTERLADEAFARPTQPKDTVGDNQRPKSANVDSLPVLSTPADVPPQTVSRLAVTEDPARGAVPLMVSRGTMTSPSSYLTEPVTTTRQPTSSYEPTAASVGYRASSQLLPSRPVAANAAASAKANQASLSLGHRPSLPGMHRSRSHNSSVFKLAAASRPSLEERRIPSLGTSTLAPRSQGAGTGRRPASLYLDPHGGGLHDRETPPDPVNLTYGNSILRNEDSQEPFDAHSGSAREDMIHSSVDFLRAMEDEDGSRKKEKRSTSGSKHAKRSSMPSISLSNTKSLLSGKFGEAFRRFESNSPSQSGRSTSPRALEGRRLRDLSPIAVSEAASDRDYDGLPTGGDESKGDDGRRGRAPQLPAEVSADYGGRLADRKNKTWPEDADGRHVGGSNKAASIQHKVKTLLDENTRPSPGRRVNGHGPAINSSATLQAYHDVPPRHPRMKPGSVAKGPATSKPPPTLLGPRLAEQSGRQAFNPTSPTVVRRIAPAAAARPSAPPKPDKLKMAGPAGPSPRPQPLDRDPSAKATRPVLSPPSALAATGETVEDWEANFSKRYPSLSRLEMVETSIDRPSTAPSTSLNPP